MKTALSDVEVEFLDIEKPTYVKIICYFIDNL
jgi:hypothetical protein